MRAFVFRHRGTLLAIPALALVGFGRPTLRSVAVGLPMALLGEALRCWAVGYSGATTRDNALAAPRLAVGGPYAHTRNPLYLGNLITALGFTIAFTGGLDAARRWLLTAFGLGTMLGVYAAIVPHEEAFLDETFGDEYADYAVRVPRVGWRVKPAQFMEGSYDGSVILRAESRTFATFAAMAAALALKVRRPAGQ